MTNFVCKKFNRAYRRFRREIVIKKYYRIAKQWYSKPSVMYGRGFSPVSYFFNPSSMPVDLDSLCWVWDIDIPSDQKTDLWPAIDWEDVFRNRLITAQRMFKCHSPYKSQNPRNNGYNSGRFKFTIQERIHQAQFKEYMSELRNAQKYSD